MCGPEVVSSSRLSLTEGFCGLWCPNLRSKPQDEVISSRTLYGLGRTCREHFSGYVHSQIITILSWAPMENTCKSKAVKKVLPCLMIVILQLWQLEGLGKSYSISTLDGVHFQLWKLFAVYLKITKREWKSRNWLSVPLCNSVNRFL